MAPPTTVLEIRRQDPPRGSLVAFLKAQLPSGLIVRDSSPHVSGSRCWVTPPGIPWMKGGHLVLKDGKPQYSPAIDFANHGCRSRWSREIIAAIRRQHPEIALPTEDQEQEALK